MQMPPKTAAAKKKASATKAKAKKASAKKSSAKRSQKEIDKYEAKCQAKAMERAEAKCGERASAFRKRAKRSPPANGKAALEAWNDFFAIYRADHPDKEYKAAQASASKAWKKLHLKK